MNSVTVEKIAEIFIDNQIDELREVCISHVFATNYAKSTEIWLSFACLHFYEQFKDKYFLDYLLGQLKCILWYSLYVPFANLSLSNNETKNVARFSTKIT